MKEVVRLERLTSELMTPTKVKYLKVSKDGVNRVQIASRRCPRHFVKSIDHQ